MEVGVGLLTFLGLAGWLAGSWIGNYGLLKGWLPSRYQVWQAKLRSIAGSGRQALAWQVLWDNTPKRQFRRWRNWTWGAAAVMASLALFLPVEPAYRMSLAALAGFLLGLDLPGSTQPETKLAQEALTSAAIEALLAQPSSVFQPQIKQLLQHRPKLRIVLLDRLQRKAWDSSQLAEPFLFDADPTVRKLAAQLVLAYQPAHLLPHLEALVRDEATGVRAVGYRLLPQLPYEQKREFYLRLLNQARADRREEVLELTIRHQAPFQPQDLLQLLNHDWPQLRFAAARMLTAHRDPSLAPAIQQHLDREPDERVYVALLAALAGRDVSRSEFERYRRHVLLNMADSHRRIGIQAMRLWRNSPLEGQALQTLLQALESPDLATRLRIVVGDTIAAFGAAAVPLLAQQLQAWRGDNRFTALRILALIATPDALRILAQHVTDHDERIRRMALQAAAFVQADDNRGLLEQGLADPDELIVRRTIQKIEDAPDIRLMPSIYAALQSHSRGRAFLPSNFGLNDLAEGSLEAELLQLARHVIRSQQGVYRQAHPHAYCTHCETRSAQFRPEWGEPPAWAEYVVCRTCHDVRHLVAPLRQVIGRVGPVPLSSPEGVRHVAVWHEAQKQITPADLDILEVEAGHDLSYDWTLTALLQHWQESDRPMPQVVLQGAVSLSPNTLRMLADAGVNLTQAEVQSPTFDSALEELTQPASHLSPRTRA